MCDKFGLFSVIQSILNLILKLENMKKIAVKNLILKVGLH